MRTLKTKLPPRPAGLNAADKKVIGGMEEAIDYLRGNRAGVRVTKLTARHFAPAAAPVVDGARVKQIRRKLRMSQAAFARALNVSKQSVQAWEQDMTVPSGATLRLLQITER